MAQESWSIKRCLDWTSDYLGRKGIERPRLSAEWLLTAVTGLSRVSLYTNFDRPLSPEELSRMRTYITRRASGEPLQYITGVTSFRMIDVLCAPGVLIPRPETEVLVEEVLTYLDREIFGIGGPGGKVRAHQRAELPWNQDVERELKKAGTAAQDAEGELSAEAHMDTQAVETPPCARVLEVGCGTGCISLSLAHERPGCVEMVATDIAQEAIQLALKNREALGIDAETLDIRYGDLTDPIHEDELGTFDVLVSNPPYIPSRVMQQLPSEVAAWEPHLALEGGDDGLMVFRRLLEEVPHMLRPGGFFACELFEGAVGPAAELCREQGLDHIAIVRDLTDRPRIVTAYKPASA